MHCMLLFFYLWSLPQVLCLLWYVQRDIVLTIYSSNCPILPPIHYLDYLGMAFTRRSSDEPHALNPELTIFTCSLGARPATRPSFLTQKKIDLYLHLLLFSPTRIAGSQIRSPQFLLHLSTSFPIPFNT
ncbi:hypothetical protein F5B20DRAFT_258600 [Whalleya microplaca]|nr:hypothetical protein F5B20DRAFT_258600 [Whalleya microplaca]